MFYRKKPVVIEAIPLTWETWSEMCDFLGDIIGEDNPARFAEGSDDMELTIPTLEGDHLARHGDFIIKGVRGEFYPCKPDIFAETYERVEGERVV